jgi:GDP-L-fucose synthase
VKKLLFLGSSCIYPRLAPQPIREESFLDGKLEPTNEAYAVAKIAGIVLCRSYNRQHGTDFVPVMPTNLYGPGDRFDLVDSHVLPAMIRKLRLARLLAAGDWGRVARDLAAFGNGPAAGAAGGAGGEVAGAAADPAGLERHLARFGIHPGRVVLWGTGSPRREFLHVDDLADACVFLMNRQSGSDIVNIGTGEDISIGDLAALVNRVTGTGCAIEFDRASPDGTPRKLLDVARLHALGWRHRIPLEEGIASTYRWYLARTDAQET